MFVYHHLYWPSCCSRHVMCRHSFIHSPSSPSQCSLLALLPLLDVIFFFHLNFFFAFSASPFLFVSSSFCKQFSQDMPKVMSARGKRPVIALLLRMARKVMQFTNCGGLMLMETTCIPRARCSKVPFPRLLFHSHFGTDVCQYSACAHDRFVSSSSFSGGSAAAAAAAGTGRRPGACRP